jgi:hypothetical protein
MRFALLCAALLVPFGLITSASACPCCYYQALGVCLPELPCKDAWHCPNAEEKNAAEKNNSVVTKIEELFRANGIDATVTNIGLQSKKQ